jgi:hypothetical protein
MRLYGKRFMARRTEARIGDRRESRDGVVYDISESLRYCRVRIAGTATLVRAWFPANFMRAPDWLKVGVAVRISHVGGDKSRIEVISPGLIQPSQATSPMSGGVDTILLGMMPTADGTGWLVEISTGSYRIGGISYLFNPGGALLGDGMTLGSGITLGSGTFYEVDPISEHDEGELWFRYDAFVVGTDGVVDYVKGDEWMWVKGGSGPTKPLIPSGHVLIRNYILVRTGMEAVSQSDIGREWVAPFPDRLIVASAYSDPWYEPLEYNRPTDVGVVWGGPRTYQPASPEGPARGAIATWDMMASFTVTVVDQYGYPYSWWTDGSINQLAISFLGSGSYDGYGDITVGFPAVAIPTVEDESGQGPETTVALGLGYMYTFNYTRKHTVYTVIDPEEDGYPSYAQADSDSHTGIFNIRLISAEATHPVFVIVPMWNLAADGSPM